MASIRTNDGPDGMKNDFEQSAAHLLPYDPVAKKHAAGSNKRGSAEVSAVSYEATDVAAFGTKPGIGRSGVHFCYYDKSEYSKLTKEQKTELCEWRSKGGAGWGRGDAKTKKAKSEKAVAAAVEKKINEQAKASEEEKMAGEKLRSLVASTIKEAGGTTTSGRRATTIGATTATGKLSNPMTQNWGRPMSPEAVLAKPKWNAYGPHPVVMRADRPTWPDPSPPSTSPSLKGILKKAKNDEKSWLGPAMDVSSIEMDGYKTSKPENEELWDPGGDPQRTELVNITLSSPLHALLSTTNTCDRESDEMSEDNEGEESMSRTDSDSHANMVVVGRHAYILSDTGRTADVNAFTPDYESMQVPIVDAAVQYECPYSGMHHVLVIRNALHVPPVRHNFVPPFMIREEGIQVNDTPKIQVNDPTTSDHSIYFPETGFRIPLSL